MKCKAFIVVGYSNWGKSETLKHLVAKRRGWITISGNKFFLRRMSNSDDPESYELFIRRMSNSDIPKSYYNFITNKRNSNRNLILTFNPNYNKIIYDKEKYRVNDILNIINKTHNCFFFILRKYFKHPSYKKILTAHIDNLKKYGHVQTTESRDKYKRTKEFREFILKNLKD